MFFCQTLVPLKEVKITMLGIEPNEYLTDRMKLYVALNLSPLKTEGVLAYQLRIKQNNGKVSIISSRDYTYFKGTKTNKMSMAIKRCVDEIKESLMLFGVMYNIIGANEKAMEKE